MEGGQNFLKFEEVQGTLKDLVEIRVSVESLTFFPLSSFLSSLISLYPLDLGVTPISG